MDGAAYEIFVARSLESIIQEIDPGYSGSRSLIQQQQQALPGETAAQLDGLTARAEQSHTNILDSARRRGLGFGGIPIGEQVKYDSTEFKPAVANLYSSQNQRKMSLEESLNSLYRDQRSNALNLRESEVNREEQQRQFNENLALQREQMAEQRRQAERAAQQVDLSNYLNSPEAAAESAKLEDERQRAIAHQVTINNLKRIYGDGSTQPKQKPVAVKKATSGKLTVGKARTPNLTIRGI